jgi:hypothetical protein
MKPDARFMNNHARQPAFLIGNGRFRRRAQHHSYTNEMTGGDRRARIDAAQAFDTSRRYKFGRPTV